MDIEYIKNVIVDKKYDREKLVNFGDILSKSDCEFLSSITTSQLNEVLPRSSNVTPNSEYFIVICDCKSCGNEIEMELRKGKFLDYMTYLRNQSDRGKASHGLRFSYCDDNLCVSCRIKKQLAKKEQEKREREQFNASKAETTKLIFGKYLMPGYDFAEKSKLIFMR